MNISSAQPGDGTVILNGVDVRNRKTDFDPNLFIVGGGPSDFNININNVNRVEVNSSLNLGSGNLTITANEFTNNFAGGQRIEVGTFDLTGSKVDIGTNAERIFAKNVILRSDNIGINTTNPPVSFNLSTDELIALQTKDLSLISRGNILFGQSSSGSTDLSQSVTKSYSVETQGDIFFQQLVKFPNNANLDLITTNTSNIFAQTQPSDSNPNAIDFINDGGSVSFGRFNNGTVRGVAQVGGSKLGPPDKPLSFAIKELKQFYSFGDTWIRNHANPTIGGQNADLYVGLILQNTASKDFRIESLNGGLYFTDQVVVNGNLEVRADFYQLSTAIAQLTGLGSVALRPIRDSYDIKIGTKSTNPEVGVFKIPFADISTANSRPKITTQKLIIGQKALVGNIFIYRDSDDNLVPVEGYLDLFDNRFDLTFEAKDSDILLNCGIKLNTNRRFTLDIGVGQLLPRVTWTNNTSADVWIPDNGIINLVSTGQIGSIDRPLYTQSAYLDRSNAASGPTPLAGDINLQNQGALGFLNQINAGVNAFRLYATDTISRNNTNAYSDLVAGSIELWSDGKSLGGLNNPFRITGSSLVAQSQGDIALALMNFAGTDGAAIEISNTASMRLRGKGGTPLTPGIRSRTTDDDANKTVQGTIFLTGINGSQTIPSVFKLNNNNLINTVTSGNDASLKLGEFAVLDMNRYAQELRILRGAGKITSDPIPGQARSLTFAAKKPYDSSRFDGTIEGAVELVVKNQVGNIGAKLSESGTLTLTGNNTLFTGGVRIEGGTAIAGTSSAMGTGPIQIGIGAILNDESALGLDPNLTKSGAMKLTNEIRLVGKKFQILNLSGQNSIQAKLELVDGLTIDVAPNPDSTAQPWSLSMDQSLTGIGELKKTNAGMLVLTQTNDFLGGLDVVGGTVEVQESNSLGDGKITFRQNTNLQMRQPTGSTTPLTLVIPTASGIVFEGNNRLISLGDGEITADNGSLNLRGAVNGVFTIEVAGGKRLTLNSTDAFQAIDAGVTAADVVRAGTGALTLNGANNFRNLSVRSGSVIGNVTESFGSGEILAGRQGTTGVFGTVAFDPGAGNTLNLSNILRIQGNGSDDPSTPVYPDRSVLKTLSGSVIFTGQLFLESTPQVSTFPIFVEDTSSLDIRSQVDDRGANITLEKKGLGDLILRLPTGVPANQLGGVDLRAGTIQVFSTRSLGTGLINVLNGGRLYVDLGYDPVTSLPIRDTFANPFRINGFGPKGTSSALDIVTGIVTINRDLYLDGNAAIEVDSVDAVLEHKKANILQGSGAFGIVKKGQGTLSLEASTGSKFSGPSRIETGIVIARSSNSLGQAAWTIPVGTGLKLDAGTPGLPMVLNNNLTLEGTGYIPQPGTGLDPMKGVIESGPGTIATIQGNLSLTGETTLYAEDGAIAANGLTINGVIDESKAGQTFGILKKGTGRVSFAGTTANAYGGTTSVLEGTLELMKTDAAGAAGSILISNGASLGLGSTSTATTTINNPVSGEGTGYLSRGAVIAAGGRAILTRSIVVADTDKSGTTQLFLGAKSQGDLTLSGSISIPAGGITPVDLVSGDGGTTTGTVRFNAANGYNGVTTVRAGTLVSNAAKSTGSNSKLVVLSGGTFEWTGAESLNITEYTVSGTGDANKGALRLSGTTDRSEGAKIVFGDDAAIRVEAGRTLTLTSPLSETAGSQSDLIKQGDGTLLLPGANLQTGNTQVRAGTLRIQSAGALGANKSSKLSVAQGATLAIDLLMSGGAGTFLFENPLDLAGDGFGGEGAIDLIRGNVHFKGSGNLMGGKSVTINTDAGNRLILEGDFANSGSTGTRLVKTGPGNLTLGGNNKYDETGSARTSVTQGVLTLWNPEGTSESVIGVSENAKLEIINKLGLPSPMVISNKLELSGFGPAGGQSEVDAALWVGGIENNVPIPTSAVFTGGVNIRLSSQTANGRTRTALGASSGSSGRFEGVISQNPDVGSNQVQIVKNGLGEIALVPQSGPNQFRGGMEINDGTVIVGATGGAGSGPLSTIQIDQGNLLLQGGKSGAPVTLQNQITVGKGNIGIGTDVNSFASITRDFTSSTSSFTLEARTGSELTLTGSVLRSATVPTLALNKTGGGKLILASSKSNQVNGGFNVRDGVVDLQVPNAPAVRPYDGPLTIENQGRVNLVLANQIPSNAPLMIRTGGTLDLLGKDTQVGQVTLQGGQILSSGKAATGTLSSDSDFLLNEGTVSANLSGKAGIRKSSSGALTLTGNNSFQGGVTVNAGLLTVSGGTAVPNTATITLAGPTGGLALGSNEGFGNLVVQDAKATLDLNGKTLTLLGDQDTLLKGITLPNGGTLIKQGTKSLVVQNANALGNAVLSLDPGVALDFDFSGTQNFPNSITLGSKLLSKQGNAVLDGPVVLGTGSLAAEIAGNVKLTQTLTRGAGIAQASLVKSGTGVLDLASTQLNGPITVQAGNLMGSMTNSFGTGSVAVQSKATVTLNAPGLFGNSITIQGTGFDGNGSLVATGGTSILPRTITVNNLNLNSGSTIRVDEFTTLIIAGITGTGDIVKSGKGQVIFSPGVTLPGSITVNEGSLKYNPSITGTITVGKDGILVLDTTVTVPNPIKLAGTILAEPGVVGTLTGPIEVSGNPKLSASTGATLHGNGAVSGEVTSLDIPGQGTVILNGANSFTGTVGLKGSASSVLRIGSGQSLGTANDLEIEVGTLRLGTALTVGSLFSSGDQGVLDLSSFDLTFGSSSDRSYSGAITGNGKLLKQGPGNQTFAGQGKFTFAGDLLVQGGKVTLNKEGSARPALPANATIGSGSSLVIAGPGQLGSNSVIRIQGGSLDLGPNRETVQGLRLENKGSILGSGSIRSLTKFQLLEGTVHAILEGTAGLEKSGPGTVTLWKTNPLTGSVDLLGGVLAIGANQTFADLNGTGGEIALLPGANLVLQVGTNKTYAGKFSGSGTLTKTGIGTLTLTGNSPITGETIVQQGRLLLNGSGSFVLSGTVSVKTGATLELGSSDQLKPDGKVILDGGVFALGNNKQTLSMLEVLPGGLVSGGLGGGLTVDGQVMMRTTRDRIQAPLSGPADWIYQLLGGDTLSTPLPTSGAFIVEAGTITLSSVTVPAISGNVVLRGPNSVLVLDRPEQIGNGSLLQVSEGARFDIGSNNETVAGIALLDGTLTGTTGILSSATSITVESGTIEAILDGTDSTVGLVKTNSTKTVTVSSINRFLGEVQVLAGTLVLNAPGMALASLAVTVNGGILAVSPLASLAQLSSSAQVKVTAGTLDVANTAQTFETVRMTGGELLSDLGNISTKQENFEFTNGRVAATLAGPQTGVIINGSGTVTFAKRNAYGGLTQIEGGTLIGSAKGTSIPGDLLISSGRLLTREMGQIAATAKVTLAGGSIDALNSTLSEKFTELVLLEGLIGPQAGGASGSIEVERMDLQKGRINASIKGSAKLVKTSPGLVTLSGSNGFTGGSEILEGTLNLAAPLGLSLPGRTTVEGGAIVLQAANQFGGALEVKQGMVEMGAFSASVTAFTLLGGGVRGTTGVLTSTTPFTTSEGSLDVVLGGPEGLIKQGTGLVTLSQRAQYSGITTITGGILQLSGNGSLPDGSTVDIRTGARLDLNGLSDQVSGLKGSGEVTLGSVGGNSFSLSGTSQQDPTQFSGVISGMGDLVKVGPGTQILSGPNTFSGSVKIQGGELSVEGTFASVLPDNGPVEVFTDATLSIKKNEQTGPVTGRGTIFIDAGDTLTGTFDGPATAEWVLSGTGTFQKAGTGKLIIASNSPSFGGTLRQTQGTVSIVGNLGGTVSLLGGTLLGTGSITNLTGAGGTFSPGSSPGTITVGSMGLSSGSVYLQEISGNQPGTGYDQTIIKQSVNLTGSKLTVALGSGFAPRENSTFVMVNNQSNQTVVGSFQGLPEGATFAVGQSRFRISYRGGDGNDVVLTATKSGGSPVGMILGSPGNTGGQSLVSLYNSQGSVTRSFVPFAGYGGSLRTASGDINGDGTLDIIVATGTGSVPAVRVFDGVTGTILRNFMAYATNYLGGVGVAAGDIDNDGFADIITGTLTSTSHIRVFSGKTGATLRSFFAFGAGYVGGVNIAAGDVNGDQRADIIVGAGTNSSHTIVFSGLDSRVLASFFAFGSGVLPGGVFVASADLNGDGMAEILTGKGSGGGTPQIRVFNGPGATAVRTINLNGNYANGARVTLGDLNGDGVVDLIAGAGPGFQPLITAYAAANGAFIRSLLAYPANFRGGVVF